MAPAPLPLRSRSLLVPPPQPTTVALAAVDPVLSLLRALAEPALRSRGGRQGLMVKVMLCQVVFDSNTK
jgi:hypothetical protein